MLQELPMIDGDTRFDPNVEVHINLVCLQCGSIRDFDSRAIEDMVTKVAKTARFDVRGQSLAVYGVCQDCDLKKGA
jgi:Fe2+ or Zn2+ uptake regulation protein